MENDKFNNDKAMFNKLNLSAWFKFTVYRIVFVIILILALTLIKFCFKEIFGEIKSFYNSNISVNITADYFSSLGGNIGDA